MICFLVFAWHLPTVPAEAQATFLAFRLHIFGIPGNFCLPPAPPCSCCCSCSLSALHYVASLKRFKFNACASPLPRHRLGGSNWKFIAFTSRFIMQGSPSRSHTLSLSLWVKLKLVTNRELVLLLLLIKTACGSFYAALLLPFSNLHFHFNARWQFPFAANSLTPPLYSPPPAAAASTTSQHVLEPSEPQLLTNWRLDLIWNVQITNIIKDEQRQLSLSSRSSARID